MARVIEWPRLVGGPGHGTVINTVGFGHITFAEIGPKEHIYQEGKYIINAETAVRVYVYSRLTRQEKVFAVRTELLEHAMQALGMEPL